MNTTPCLLDQPCRRYAAAHADDYEIADVSVHLGGAWSCPVHGIGEDDEITVSWGTVEVSLDAADAVRENAAGAERELGRDDARTVFIRTPVHVAIYCRVTQDVAGASRRRLAARLAGVVLHHAVGEGDLDRELRLSLVGWTAVTEEGLIDRAGWTADALLSARGAALPSRVVLDGLDYEACADMHADVSPESVAIHIQVCDLGDLSVKAQLRRTEPVADRGDVDWLITITEDAIANHEH